MMPKSHLPRVLVLTLALLPCCAAAEAAQRGASAPVLDSAGLIRAVLVASGVEGPDRLSQYENQWAKHCDRLPRAAWGTLSTQERAVALRDWLHVEILIGRYQVEASQLDRLFESGDYNCLSATICYMALARQLDVPVRAVAVPGHIYVELAEQNQVYSLEIVSFASDLRPAHQTHGRTPRRILNDRQLTALVYYNRGAHDLAQRRYAQAGKMNVLALALDPQQTAAAENLLAAVNNWAVTLSGQQRHAEARALLEWGLKLDPAEESLKLNIYYVEHLRQRHGSPAALNTSQAGAP